jgi:hypothetical protein
MAGDYTKFQRHYGNLTTDLELAALSPNPQAILVPRNANYQVFIQSAELVVTAYGAGTIKLVGHVTGRVFALFNVPAAPSSNDTDIFYIDYGPTGLGCNIGETVDVSSSNVAIGAFLHIEAYNKLAVVIGSNASPAN